MPDINLENLVSIEKLPSIPEGIHEWDGEYPVDCVSALWNHPDTWESLAQPTLYLYQGVIGEPIDEDHIAVDLAAEYLESCGWEILDQSTDKDWAWYNLAPPPSPTTDWIKSPEPDAAPAA